MLLALKVMHLEIEVMLLAAEVMLLHAEVMLLQTEAQALVREQDTYIIIGCRVRHKVEETNGKRKSPLSTNPAKAFMNTKADHPP